MQGQNNASDFRILIVDDDRNVRDYCSRILQSNGYKTEEAVSAENALTRITEDGSIGVVVLNLKLPGVDGMHFLETLLDLDEDLEVIMISSPGVGNRAISALKKGASDFIEKPFKKKRLLAAVQKAVEVRTLSNRLKRVLESRGRESSFPGVIGISPPMQKVYEQLKQAASVEGSVLIEGEPGTGKQHIARTIHQQSSRATAPFIPVDCSALPEDLLKSELFGHRYSDPRASGNTSGYFRSADGGTLYLGNVRETPKSVQEKLLKTLKTRTVRPVGGTEDVDVDVRIMAGVEAPAKRAESKTDLKADLYYRLSVIEMDLPPLERRISDIPLLVNHFLDEYTDEDENPIYADPEAMKYLMTYGWPGNLRELEEAIQTVCREANQPRFQPHHLPDDITETRDRFSLEENQDIFSFDGSIPSLQKMERKLIEHALEVTEGNKSEAARQLNISRNKLYRCLKKYDITDGERVQQKGK